MTAVIQPRQFVRVKCQMFWKTAHGIHMLHTHFIYLSTS